MTVQPQNLISLYAIIGKNSAGQMILNQESEETKLVDSQETKLVDSPDKAEKKSVIPLTMIDS